jgi:hypothetical protein
MRSRSGVLSARRSAHEPGRILDRPTVPKVARVECSRWLEQQDVTLFGGARAPFVFDAVTFRPVVRIS